MKTSMILAIFAIFPAVSLVPSKSTMAADEGMMIDKPMGTASYYSAMAHGERTASGEIFDKNAMVAAHPFLPFGTVVQVSDLDTERSVKVRIIDRGPSESHYEKGVIIILSPAAAQELGFINKGTAQVKLDITASE